ncbi:MAG: glycosyl hydrolase [Parcubacteria group bacterium Gr01-1014_8]|nr:MAG: glycosyl hydrolase [Parcubacteria group bacterium Gr01-1014_8]
MGLLLGTAPKGHSFDCNLYMYSSVTLNMSTLRHFLSVPRVAFLLLFFLYVFLPHAASAAVISKPFEISGWIPYWRTATGTADTLVHLETFTEVNPFVYTVTNTGRLNDAGSLLTDASWIQLKQEAKLKGVRFIPTVMWSNPDAMHAVLSDTATRQLLVRMIVDEAVVNEYDGIDIDFEGKYAKTRPYFSKFLQELYKGMGNKWVQCTIESRTPIADRYFGTEPPSDAGEYANDFAVINKNCDRVRFMTYDQQNVDQKLASETTEPYGPVADTDWVEKAIREAMKTIPKRKIVLGIATYGYEWDVRTYANNEHVYDLLWTFNPKYGLELASKYNITPGRNAGGELGFTYFPEGAAISLPRPSIPWPYNLIASAASALTTANNSNMSYRMVTWSDAEAIGDKVDLAKRLGIRGVAIFKIDGGEDPGMWEALK